MLITNKNNSVDIVPEWAVINYWKNSYLQYTLRTEDNFVKRGIPRLVKLPDNAKFVYQEWQNSNLSIVGLEFTINAKTYCYMIKPDGIIMCGFKTGNGSSTDYSGYKNWFQKHKDKIGKNDYVFLTANL